jgi:hypothetical protein
MTTFRLLSALALLGLSGCMNWQATYDNAARSDCRERIDSAERRACLDRVEENSRQHRADQRN